jgi:hypothetical protein
VSRLLFLLRSEVLDPDDRRRVEEDMAALSGASLTERQQLDIAKRIKSLCPGVLQTGAVVIQGLLTAAVTHQLGLS